MEEEWTLSSGTWRAVVSPMGASLRQLWIEPEGGGRRDVLWGYSGSGNKKGGQGDVLAPWPGRIRNGTYSFRGAGHELPLNDKDGPNAIHGFLRARTWQGEQAAPNLAHFATRISATDHAGYPFELDVAIGYELLPSGLACAFVARNVGPTPAPFGIGFHPYIAAALASEPVQVPAAACAEYAGLLPTGRVVPVPGELDFRTPRPVGSTRINHCLTGLARGQDGFARIQVGGTELWMDSAFPFVVLYTGDALGADARRGLAVEPMTCGPDAFNHEGSSLGATTLEPGGVLRGTWGIALR